MNEEHLIIAIVSVAGLGIAAQWIAWRLKMPAIIFLAAFGLIFGPGLGFIHPSDDFGEMLPAVVSLAADVAVGAAAYALALAALWHFAGRPEGPENAVLHFIARRTVGRLRG